MSNGMPKRSLLAFLALSILTEVLTTNPLIAADQKTGTFLRLREALQSRKTLPSLNSLPSPVCLNPARGGSQYKANVYQTSWRWTSENEPEGRPIYEDRYPDQSVDVPNLSDILWIDGDFSVVSLDGSTLDCSRVTGQVRFKVTIPGPTDYSDLPWHSLPMTLARSSDTYCIFTYSIPVRTVNDLINDLPDYTSGAHVRGETNSRHQLAVFLSAAGPSCAEWHQKYSIMFEEIEILTHYNFSLKPWDRHIGPDPAVR